MASSPFAIVNLRTGTQRDVVPFLLDNDAFPLLENAYLFRGRIQRRSCYRAVGLGDGRLKWIIGTTGASPFTTTLIDIPIGVAYAQFTIGSVVFTDPGGASPVALLSSDALYAGTLDRTTGALSLTHPAIAATSVFYLPGLPVMGLRTRERININSEYLIAFDTRYSYILDTSVQDFRAANTYKLVAPNVTDAVFTWSGANYEQFWTYNYLGAMWTTNNNYGLNGYNVTNGTDAAPAQFDAPAGHSILVGDIIEVITTSPANTLAGFSFQVTVVAGNVITINNPVAPGGGAWTGTVSQLNRRATGAGAITGDGIKIYDGPGAGTGWANFIPPLNAQTTATTTPRYLRGCLLIVAYKNRVICFNTYESDGAATPVNYAQRARWSQNGTPYYAENNNATVTSRVEYLAPVNQTVQQDAWYDTTPGKGGYIDAPTNEAIVSCEFIKDTLIVYFEESTWQLVYNFNETLPFYWQKINTELGAESTFSVVPFDNGVYAVGDLGIITCNSVQVQRLDQKIPDEVFQIQNRNNGVKRVSGIRDYNAQLVYWAYPINSDEDGSNITYDLTFPNQVLVFNYLDGSWSEFDDNFTCFGYWFQTSDISWSQLIRTWESTSFAWNSQVQQSDYPNVAAGNQRGFAVVFSQLQQLGQNSPNLEISNASGNTVTIPDHNLVNGDYVLITSMTGFTTWNGEIYSVANATATTFDLMDLDASGALVPAPTAAGYTGAGMVTYLPNMNITTKEFNPFYQDGDSVRANYIDLLMDRTEDGELTFQFYTNSQTSIPLESITVPTSPESSLTYSSAQTRIFHRCYTNSFGAFIQNIIKLSDTQMRELNIATSDITIHSLIYYFSPAGRVSYDL